MSIAGETLYKFADNPFESLVVDITSRCNMSCGFCYNPQRSQPDMPLEYFEQLCAALPFPVRIKIGGGEPVLHPLLPDFIRVAHRYRHTVYILSNGARYADAEFMRSLTKLRAQKINFTLGLSLDGGCLNRDAYKLINGQDCLESKMQAFQALVASGLGRICLTAIIVRGVNEDVISQLILLAREHTKSVRYIHFRNAGKTGLWLETEPYTLQEMEMLTRNYFSEEQFRPQCVNEVHCLPDENRKCCYRFRPSERLQISLIEFNSDRSLNCPKRGRVIYGIDAIQPLFVSMR